ncbi:MAG TPA: replication initiation factor domain-containing protein [Patescibacteria group bacterium]|nr:replication initiation factor domain-containing protein [Patescibacteria group bacterium]
MNTNGNYNACLDWVTLVGEDGDGETKPMREAVAAMEKLVEQHGQWHSFSLQGYEGQTCGPISAGFKGDNFIIRISGKAADEIETLIPSFATCKPTRVDYQVTIQLEKPDKGLASRTFAIMEKSNGLVGPKRFLAFFTSNSDTLYVGKRTSPVMLRLYDKTPDVNTANSTKYPPGSFWRYEVEYKRQYARTALDTWFAAGNRTELIEGVVSSEFLKRGAPSFGSVQEYGTALKAYIAPTTTNSNLKWLKTTVRPVFQRLISSGLEREALMALGQSLIEDWDN